MTAEQEITWNKIRTFELDDPSISLTFYRQTCQRERLDTRIFLAGDR